MHFSFIPAFQPIIKKKLGTQKHTLNSKTRQNKTDIVHFSFTPTSQSVMNTEAGISTAHSKF